MTDHTKCCPFCGEQPTIEEIEPECWDISCGNCFFSLLSGPVGLGYFESEEKAITAWNTRHD